MRGLTSLTLIVAACLAAALPLTAAAQPYPARPIKIVLPFPAGSATDGPARPGPWNRRSGGVKCWNDCMSMLKPR